jgi:hypothetical protein
VVAVRGYRVIASNDALHVEGGKLVTVLAADERQIGGPGFQGIGGRAVAFGIRAVANGAEFAVQFGA